MKIHSRSLFALGLALTLMDGLPATARTIGLDDLVNLAREQSPIAKLHRAKTPTLILCDTGDLRVPITESYKLYHVLDDAGIPVEFVAYPVAGHFPGDPVHVRDIYRRWGDWLARWFAQ